MIKRSEFYAFMIIIMVMFCYGIASAVSYQSSVIQPTKPYKYSKEFTSAATNNSYASVIDISGKGILSSVRSMFLGSTEGNKLFVKVTVDGVAYEISGAFLTNINVASAYTGTWSQIAWNLNNGSAASPAGGLEVQGPIYFKTSLKVEIKNTGTSGNANFDQGITVNYATE
jgi:hypothetical protein